MTTILIIATMLLVTLLLLLAYAMISALIKGAKDARISREEDAAVEAWFAAHKEHTDLYDWADDREVVREEFAAAHAEVDGKRLPLKTRYAHDDLFDMVFDAFPTMSPADINSRGALTMTILKGDWS